LSEEKSRRPQAITLSRKAASAADSITIDVGSGLASSDGNLFAVRQTGDGNRVSGDVSGTGGNQSVVLQNGTGNATSFRQAGGANVLAVRQ
jgi:hypothetical protein